MDDRACSIDPTPLLGSFATDLYFPRYRAGVHGPWEIRAIAMAAARGYWGEVYRVDGALIMVGPSDEGVQSWMSTLPSEIESQEIGLRACRGHTAVFGLGMGWLAANAALRAEVERVSVVERDPDVIALIEATGVFEQLPAAARRKITLYRADAMEWKPDAPVDTLLADIWRRLLEDGKAAAVRRMQANTRAREIYFWGQEMEIWRHACRRADAPAKALAWIDVEAIVTQDLQLPLILPEAAEYPQRIVRAAPWWTPPEPRWWQLAH